MAGYNKHATRDVMRQQCNQVLRAAKAKEIDPDAHLANFDADEPWGGLDEAIIEFGHEGDVLNKDDCVEELSFG